MQTGGLLGNFLSCIYSYNQNTESQNCVLIFDALIIHMLLLKVLVQALCGLVGMKGKTVENVNYDTHQGVFISL